MPQDVSDLLLPFDSCRQRLPLLVGYHMQVVGISSADSIVADRIAMCVQRHVRIYRFSVLVIGKQCDAWQQNRVRCL